jgi:hypothetical protein
MARKAIEMRFFHEHQNGKLKCPYNGCEKEFDTPTVIIDASMIPRETHYTCPHCMSKLDIVTKDTRVIGVNAIESPKVFEPPAQCDYLSGLLNGPRESMFMQEECLMCPKVLQCNIRSKNNH